MDVGEQDFHQFKRDQHILVEFSVFPLKIIELIHLCLSQPATETSNVLSSGYFSHLSMKAFFKIWFMILLKVLQLSLRSSIFRPCIHLVVASFPLLK